MDSKLMDVSREALLILQEPKLFEIYYGGRFITILHNISRIAVVIFSYTTK